MSRRDQCDVRQCEREARLCRHRTLRPPAAVSAPGAPADSLGENGDAYLDTTAGIFYQRAGGSYGRVYGPDQGDADGVIDGLSLANDGTATATRTVGADITGDFSTAINALIDAAVTGLTNAEVEDETDTTTEGLISPAVLAHAVGLHQSVFVRDTSPTTGTLLNNAYSVTTLASDRPPRFPEGSLVQFLAPDLYGLRE